MSVGEVLGVVAFVISIALGLLELDRYRRSLRMIVTPIMSAALGDGSRIAFLRIGLINQASRGRVVEDVSVDCRTPGVRIGQVFGHYSPDFAQYSYDVQALPPLTGSVPWEAVRVPSEWVLETPIDVAAESSRVVFFVGWVTNNGDQVDLPTKIRVLVEAVSHREAKRGPKVQASVEVEIDLSETVNEAWAEWANRV